ncbi:MAG: hypothetical protein CMC70_11780 [Flavobacteriaceae bacterium]|nr:hypothetical protein [Flavobacteriaceae bacterium]
MSLTFCSKDTTPEENLETADRVLEGGDPVGCETVNLIAAQNYDAGDFTISENEDGDLILRYETMDGWEINEIHLYAGDCAEVPMNTPGNPKIGNFPISETLANGTTVYEYLLDVADGTTFCGCIAAHAVVSNSGQTETAWAEGIDFPGNSWAMFNEFCGCS